MFADRYYYRRHPVVWVLIIYLLLLAVSWPWLVTQPSALQGQIGQTAMLNGTVRESRNGLSYLWLYTEMRNDRGHQKQELIYVVLPQPWDGEEPEQNTIWYPAGSQLQITGLLELPEPQRNPGGFSEQNWLRSKGARLRLVAEHVEVLQPPRGIWQCVYQLQQNLHRKAQQYLSSEQQGIAMALLLGEKQGLDQNFYRLTQRMGIAHIFAVSGLHVGFMGALLLWLFRLMGLERSWLSFLFLAAVLVFYCMAVGLPASALRATGMLLLAALALRLQRPSAPLDFLALTALLLLLDQPFLLTTAGFQLSFGVTLALLLFVRPLQMKLRWISCRWLRDSVTVALAAYLGSLPLTAWHFYSVSFLSPLYNLLLVPLVSALVPLLLLAFVTSWLIPPGGVLLFVPARLLLQLLLDGTVLLEHLSGGGQWFIGRPHWLACCCYGLLLFCFWLWLRDRSGANHNLWRLGAVFLLLTIGLCVPGPPEKTELLYLDAGQGSCALLRTSSGETVLFDGGTQPRELISCLAWYGINRIDAVILSHGDLDHSKGVQQVLEYMPVDYLCAEADQLERPELQELLVQARQKGTAIKSVQKQAKLTLQQEEIQLQVFDDQGGSGNSRELTALLQLQGVAVAFPGDLALAGVLQFVEAQQQITVWTVPHHGSRFSASQELYMQLRQKGAQLAVISAGRNNSYGHPHREVLQFLEQEQIIWQRTDESGAILLRLEDLQERQIAL